MLQELLAAVLAESMGGDQDISRIESSKAVQQVLTLAEYGNQENMTPVDEVLLKKYITLFVIYRNPDK